MRLRSFSVLILGGSLALLAAACSGGGDDSATPTTAPDATSTPAPTATPLATVPDPIIVVGGGSSGSGGATEEAVTYIVESGDSLGGIAARFGVDIEVIQEANDLDGVDIFIGQELTIPRAGSTSGSPGATSTPAAGATTTPPNGVDTYTVQAGDTAFGIALEFDTTVEALAAANNMTEEEITDLQIGQVLQLPRP